MRVDEFLAGVGSFVGFKGMFGSYTKFVTIYHTSFLPHMPNVR